MAGIFRKKMVQKKLALEDYQNGRGFFNMSSIDLVASSISFLKQFLLLLTQLLLLAPQRTL